MNDSSPTDDDHDAMAGCESDSTPRKRVDAALLKSEQRVRWALRAAKGGAWDWDLRTGVAWWSEEMYALWGVTPGTQMRLDGSLAIVDERDRERLRASVEASIAGDGDYHCEFRIRHHSRGLRWMASDGRVVRCENGEPVSLMGLTTDITERKAAELAISESEARFRQLADAMPQLVWTGRADGSIDYYNSRVEEYAGIEQRGEGAWSWQPVLHPDDLDPTVAAWQQAVATGDVFQVEHRVRMSDGELRWHLSRAVPVRDEVGAVLKWFGTATDIHDVKEAQEKLEESDRRKNDFLATLAHELRNPLAPIWDAVEILKLKRASDPTDRRALEIMDRQLAHMKRLVDDLLDVGRITRGDLHLSCEQVTLSQVLDHAVETARPRIQRGRHSLAVTLPEQPVLLSADPIRLAQVFSNLLSNASDYSHSGGVIRLSAEREGAEVVVCVADEGIGILPEDIPRLFEMFTQLGAPEGQLNTGLGVGLSLARTLVDLHGGYIEARSKGLGQGAELVVHLPILSQTPAPAPDQPAKPVEVPQESDLCVLVADDSEDVLDSMSLLLSLSGYRVEKARDGLEAVALAERSSPDVIFLDIGMPGLDGYQACEQIRQGPVGAHAQIYALTGWGQEDNRRRAEVAGFDDLLVKPLDPAALMGVLASVSGEDA